MKYEIKNIYSTSLPSGLTLLLQRTNKGTTENNKESSSYKGIFLDVNERAIFSSDHPLFAKLYKFREKLYKEEIERENQEIEKKAKYIVRNLGSNTTRNFRRGKHDIWEYSDESEIKIVDGWGREGFFSGEGPIFEVYYRDKAVFQNGRKMKEGIWEEKLNGLYEEALKTKGKRK